MTAIRWGILSTANIGRKKVIPGIRGAARCSVDAIASREPGRAAAVAAELDIPRAYGSYEELLADPEIDAVYIPLPNHLHAEWTKAAARAGKHVLCEKPLAMNADEAADMVAVCEAEGVRLMEAFMYRLHPSWVATRELVTSGRIGRLMSVDSWFSYFNDDPTNIRNIAEVGGGGLFDIGCYTINVSRFLFGAEPRTVDARLERDPATGVDILASAILGFDGRHGDVHLFDPDRAGPTRRRLRDRGPDPRSHPVQHPARPADRDHRHGRRRTAGRARLRGHQIRAGGSVCRGGGAVCGGHPRRSTDPDATRRRGRKHAGDRPRLRRRGRRRRVLMESAIVPSQHQTRRASGD